LRILYQSARYGTRLLLAAGKYVDRMVARSSNPKSPKSWRRVSDFLALKRG